MFNPLIIIIRYFFTFLLLLARSLSRALFLFPLSVSPIILGSFKIKKESIICIYYFNTFVPAFLVYVCAVCVCAEFGVDAVQMVFAYTPTKESS